MALEEKPSVHISTEFNVKMELIIGNRNEEATEI